MNKILITITSLLIVATFSACAVQQEPPHIEDTVLFSEKEVTVSETTESNFPDETATSTMVADTTDACISTETDIIETQIIYEYKVEGGKVWIGIEEPDETDETVLVATTVIIPEEYTSSPQDEESTKKDTESDITEETETDTPIETEQTDDTEKKEYDTEGVCSPVSTMYHSINETPFTSLTGLFVRPVDFEDQLKMLNSYDYEYIFADEFAYSDKPAIMLTFDDGYEDNYTELFPLLKKYNAKATIFMITSSIDTPGYLSSGQIKEMADSGLVRFASHTHDHLSLTSLTEEEIRYQFSKSKEILTELTGYEMDAVCYPGGSVTEEISKIAADYFRFGYTTVSSAHTYGCDPMLIPRVRVSRGVTGAGLAHLIGAGKSEY